MSDEGREWRRSGWYDSPLFLIVSRLTMIVGSALVVALVSVCTWVYLSQSNATDKRFDALSAKLDSYGQILPKLDGSLQLVQQAMDTVAKSVTIEHDRIDHVNARVDTLENSQEQMRIDVTKLQCAVTGCKQGDVRD